MVHEIFELLKALAWPFVTLFVVIKFAPGIASLLDELPLLVRRMRSAHGLGIEIELDRLDQELPLAERQAQALVLVPKPEPELEPRKTGVDNNG